jgi:hypothetical protein
MKIPLTIIRPFTSITWLWGDPVFVMVFDRSASKKLDRSKYLKKYLKYRRDSFLLPEGKLSYKN